MQLGCPVQRCKNRFVLTLLTRIVVGPLLDTYPGEIEKAIKNKLSTSHCTGLLAPVFLFMLYAIFKHFMVLVTGYGGDFNQNKSENIFIVTFNEFVDVFKVFPPARFDGDNVLKQSFKKRTQ